MMSAADNQLVFDDHRAAAALIALHAQGDTEGVHVIIQTAEQTGRGGDLIVAVLNLWRLQAPHVTSPEAIAALHSLAAKWTADSDRTEGK